MLSAIGTIGGSPDGAVSRIAFTSEERGAHDLVGRWLSDLGLKVHVDAVGNTIGELRGTDPAAPAIGIGSHLDSVPSGGRFDGVVGVVSAVEIVRLLASRDHRLRHSLRVVAFAAEEGARFGEACIGSKVVAGVLSARDLDRIHDRQALTLRQALSDVGFDPDALTSARWDPDEWAAFLELHTEQGSRLDRTGVGVGVVDMVSGSTRLMVTVNGRADHSGGTPMHERADALAATAEAIVAIESLIQGPQHHGTRVTVGMVEVEPNSITTIPGRVRFSIDVRDVDHDRQRATAVAAVELAQTICERRGTALHVDPLADTASAVLSTWIRALAAEACTDLDLPYRVMSSGASHDSQVVNLVMPAAIVFVPSRDGLSHVPQEWTSSADIATGVEVLYATLLKVDDALAA
jgi:allantoate deiminase